MATLQELEQALVNADKAGDQDAARRLAVAVRDARANQSGADLIPGQGPEIKPAPAPSIAQKAVGAGEAALATITAPLAYLNGLAGGGNAFVKRLLAEAAGAANPEQYDPGKAFEQGSAAVQYVPRTESGQEQTAAIADVAQGLAPLAGLTGEAALLSQAMRGARTAAPVTTTARAAAEGTARDVAGAAGAAAVQKTIDTAGLVADLSRNVTTLPRRALEALRGTPETPAAGTMGSAGAAGTDMATQRRVTAQSLGFEGESGLTRGQATRNAAQLKFEEEAAKNMDVGDPLRQRQVAQTEQALRTFDNFIDGTGAEVGDFPGSRRVVGQVVDKALREQMSADKARIRTAYKAAERAGEMESPVTLDGVIAHLNDSAPDAATAPLLDVARKRAVQLGLAVDDGGQLVAQPVPLKIAETFRQAIGRATDFEPTNVRQSTILKGLVDEATDGKGGQAYREARALRARFAQNYEDRAVISKLINNKRGTADRQVAFEDVFDHSILKGSLDDVRNVRRLLQRGGPEGQQAWKELQGQTVRWIKDETTKGVAKDGAGNQPISPAGLDRALRSLDREGKLDFIFGKQGAQRMRDLNDIVQYVKTVPPEVASNRANTAATLAAALADMITFASGGTPIASVARIGYSAASKHIKDARLRKRIGEALRDLDSQPSQPPRIEIVGHAGSAQP